MPPPPRCQLNAHHLETIAYRDLDLTRIAGAGDAAEGRRFRRWYSGFEKFTVLKALKASKRRSMAEPSVTAKRFTMLRFTLNSFGPERDVALGVARRIDGLHRERGHVEEMQAVGLGIDAAVRLAHAVRPQPAAIAAEERVVAVGGRVDAGRGQRDVDRAGRCEC